MFSKSHINLALLVGCVLLFAGCGSDLAANVSGVVTLDGKPLTTGTVTFHPVAGGAAAYSRINESGRYEIQTGARSGLRPGDYRVTVVALETLAGSDPNNVRRITPQKYQNLEETDLRISISAGRSEHDLKLTTHGTAADGQ